MLKIATFDCEACEIGVTGLRPWDAVLLAQQHVHPTYRPGEADQSAEEPTTDQKEG